MHLSGRQYALSDFPDGAVIQSLLEAEILAVPSLASAFERIEIEGDRVELWFQSLPELAQSMLDTVVRNHHASIDVAKQVKFDAIDKKTDEIIARGYEFAGLRFSTSLEAQARMLGVLLLKDNPLMSYPITWNSLDDNGALTIPDAATVEGFALTGIGYYRAAIDSGTALKDQVRTATTVSEVEAVTDART